MSRLRVRDLRDSTQSGPKDQGMDWLIAYRVVIDCERRRITAYTQDGTPVVF